MTFAVSIASDVMGDGIALGLFNKGDVTLRALPVHMEWEMLTEADLMVVQRPTLRLQDGMARALMDELVRHYHGASDVLALRRDYERVLDRYDKTVDAITELALR